MLLEFKAENFLSIKDPIIFSMFALEEDDSLSHNYFSTKTVKDDNILKTAVIYGANASGKTNVLRALEFVIDFVRNSHLRQKSDLTGVRPFKLTVDLLEQPSSFEVVFVYEDVKYRYGFTATPEVVVEEYLYREVDGQEMMVFERNDTYHFTFGVDDAEQVTLASRTLENVLYLSSATQWNYAKTAPAFKWFRHRIEVIIEHENFFGRGRTIEKINQKLSYKKMIADALAKADTGIVDISAENVTPLADYSYDSLVEWFHAYPQRGTSFFQRVGRSGRHLGSKGESNSIWNQYIKTYHQITNEQGETVKVEFDFEEESAGTQKLFDLLGPIIEILEEGKVLLIDELNDQLHTLLARSLVELFHNTNINKNNSQLIFSTHDSNLLNLNIFRRDQIWFTQKIPQTASTDIYSLADFEPIENEKVEQGYLAGRYGAIPILGNLNLAFQKDE